MVSIRSHFVLLPFFVALVQLNRKRSNGGEWTKLLLLLAGDIERNPGPTIDQRPRLPELISLQGKTRTINIPAEIGTRYNFVGIALLDDDSGQKVAAIHRECLGDLTDTNLKILQRWLGGEGVQDRTWRGLLVVLNTHCSSLAAEIEGALGVKRQPSSEQATRSRTPQLTTAESLPTPPANLSIFLNYLKGFYTLAKPPDEQAWPPSPSTKFINLAIISKKEVSSEEQRQFKLATLHGEIDQILDEKASISLESIFDTKEEERLECVLAEGAPGSGKTTFAWHICQGWAKGELFRQYQLVILLRLRDQTLQSATTIKDLILHQDESCQEEIAKYIKQTAGKNTLIILEGLDELPKRLLMQPSIFTLLLSGTELPKATILVTSRPSATGQLCKKWKARISRHIEILGFTEDNIDKYIHSVLDEGEIPQFTHYISATPSIRRLMYIPLHSVIVIEIYRTLRGRHKPLPTSLTSLYKALAQTILQRYLSTHKDYKDDEKYMDIDQFKDLPQDVYSDFCKLARLAYDGVREQELIFSEQIHTIQHLGFMQATPELFAHKRGTTYSYNFLHLSVQEFLAAYYVSQQDKREQEQLLQSIATKEHLRNTTRLFAGLTKFRGLNEDVVKQAIEGECEEDRDGTLRLSTYALTVVYETESASILTGHRRYTYNLDKHTPHYEFAALGYCIAHSNYKWLLRLGIAIGREIQSTEGVRLLIQALTNHSNCSYTIESIVCNYTNTQCVELLLTEVPHHVLQQIETLMLRSVTRQPLPQCLPQLVPSLDKLHRLKLWRAEGVTLTRTLELARRDTVKELDLGGCDTTAYLPPLCQWLTTPTQLETLLISHLSASDIETLCTSATHSSLKTLKLGYSTFSLPASQAFSTMLSKTSSITKVELGHCGISDEAREVLEEAKKVNKHVTIAIR